MIRVQLEVMDQGLSGARGRGMTGVCPLPRLRRFLHTPPSCTAGQQTQGARTRPRVSQHCLSGTQPSYVTSCVSFSPNSKNNPEDLDEPLLGSEPAQSSALGVITRSVLAPPVLPPPHNASPPGTFHSVLFPHCRLGRKRLWPSSLQLQNP